MKEMKYSKAIQKLDEIIRRIEQEEIDVDELSLKVKEAVELIELCKNKIEKADCEVRQVVQAFQEGDS